MPTNNSEPKSSAGPIVGTLWESVDAITAYGLSLGEFKIQPKCLLEVKSLIPVKDSYPSIKLNVLRGNIDEKFRILENENYLLIVEVHCSQVEWLKAFKMINQLNVKDSIFIPPVGKLFRNPLYIRSIADSRGRRAYIDVDKNTVVRVENNRNGNTHLEVLSGNFYSRRITVPYLVFLKNFVVV